MTLLMLRNCALTLATRRWARGRCAPVLRATAYADVARTSETSGSRVEIVMRGGAVKPEQGFLLWGMVLDREQEG